MYPFARTQAVQMCSLVAQIEFDELGPFGAALRLSVSLMFLAAEDEADRSRLLEALEHLHYI